MSEQSDQELVRRVAGGDRQAFASLYDLYAARILGLGRKMLTDVAAAEDVTQETFLVLWQKAHMYHAEKGALLTWLYRVCRNLCLDRIKRPVQNREINVQPGVLIDSLLQLPTRHLPDEDTASIAARVTQALTSLSAAERSLIEQAFFAGHSHSKIAQLTGMPLGTVKTRIATALKKMRQGLGGTWRTNNEDM